MRALLDINVLLALFDPDHVHHARASEWWGSHETFGWASCPLTQNGFARIVSKPGYTNPTPLRKALAHLALQMARPEHQFWPDEISITDPLLFDPGRILGPNKITDIYLLGLAVKNGGRLVTFDKGVPIAAVKGARAEHLVSL